jgi:hypothetical protein
MNQEMLAALGKLGFNCVVVVPPAARGTEKLVIAAFEDIEEAIDYRARRADAQVYDIEHPWLASKSGNETKKIDCRPPAADDAEGMEWYNAMTDEQRADWSKLHSPKQKRRTLIERPPFLFAASDLTASRHLLRLAVYIREGKDCRGPIIWAREVRQAGALDRLQLSRPSKYP